MLELKNRFNLMEKETFTLNKILLLGKLSRTGMLMLFVLFAFQQLNAQQCPLACNNSVQVSLDEDCEVTITPDMMLEGQGTDPGCAYTVQVKGISGAPIVTRQHIGQTLEVKVFLGSNNNNCWGYITVEDKYAPVINCPEPDTVSCYATNPFSQPTVTENCGTAEIIEVSNELLDGDCDLLSAIRMITYVAEDNSGNRSKPCVQVIAYERIGLDSIVFPLNRDDAPGQLPSLSCDGVFPGTFGMSNPDFWDTNAEAGDSVGYPDPSETGVPTTTDGFPIFPNSSLCELNATFSDSKIEICDASYKILRLWTVLDWCSGDIAQDYQIVKVLDKDGPVLTSVERDTTIFADPYDCTADFMPRIPTNVFDCGAVMYRVEYASALPDGSRPEGIYIDDNVFPKGFQSLDEQFEIRDLPIDSTWIRYIAVDDCGNQTAAFAEVLVADNKPPVAVCDEFTVVTLTEGTGNFNEATAKARALTFDDGSYDNCTDVSFRVRRMSSSCNPRSTSFGPEVFFCCADVGTTQQVVLEIADEFGQTSTCMVNVNVQDKIKLKLTYCPEDITVECGADISPQFVGGMAEGIDNCADPVVTFEDSGDLDQCGNGTITRRYTLTVADDVNTECRQRITISNTDPYNPFGNGNNLWRNIRERTISSGCMDVDTDPESTGTPEWTDTDCSLMAATYHDQVFTFVDGACFKILRTWSVIDWCTFDQSNPDAGGFWQRTQVIKLNNNDKPDLECRDTTVSITGPNCDGRISLLKTATDLCTPSDQLDWNYTIIDLADNSTEATGSSSTIDRIFSVGVYRIHWTVEDRCGNRSECDEFLTVVDGKRPTPYCRSEVTTVIMPSTGEIDIWASDFDLGSFDNCTDSADLVIAFDTLGRTREVFKCDEGGVGEHDLQVWVIDEADNKDFCRVRVQIQSNDPEGCDLSRVGGVLSTPDDQMMDAVSVTLKNANNGETMVVPTTEEGNYSFAGMAENAMYHVTAKKNDDYMNGISTRDLVLIQRHILRVNEFDNPYDFIAADVNNSESVTAADLAQLRKLILGIINELPTNDSWRFVNEGIAATSIANPWPLNEYVPVMYEGESSLGNNMKGIKIGDVDNNAKVNNFTDNDIEFRGKPASLVTYAEQFAAGNNFDVSFTAGSEMNVTGAQFTLKFDTEVATFEDFEGEGMNITADQMNLTQVGEGIIKIAYTARQMEAFKKGDQLFTISFVANQGGNTASLISLDKTSMSAEVYDEDLEISELEVAVRNTYASEVISVSQNTPNPFTVTTTINIDMPNAAKGTLKVYDVTGRSLINNTYSLDKGRNSISINAAELQANGVLYYSFESGDYSTTKKMIVIK